MQMRNSYISLLVLTLRHCTI